jgi:hypothetical protein
VRCAAIGDSRQAEDDARRRGEAQQPARQQEQRLTATVQAGAQDRGHATAAAAAATHQRNEQDVPGPI